MKARYSYHFSKPGVTGRGGVSLCIYMSRDHRKRIDTGLRLIPEEWDESRNMPVVSTRTGQYYLKKLTETQRRIEDFEFELLSRGQSLKPWLIDDLLKGKTVAVSDGLCSYIRNKIAVDGKMTSETRKVHNQTLNKLEAFNPTASLNEVNYQFLSGFDSYLHSTGLHTNTIEGHHRRLRKYLYIAVKEDIISANPYNKFKLHKIPSNRVALTMQDVESIEALDYTPSSTMDNVKQLFLFACYTGLRYGEIRNLRVEDCELTNNGWEISLHEFRKYPTPLFLPLWGLFCGKPQDIFTRYLHGPEGLKMRIYSNQKINMYLKVVAHDAGVKKPISFHIARHTFGTLLGAMPNADVFLVKDLMGHSDIKTSMVYIKSTPEIIRNKVHQLFSK